jgi:copper transport protein
MSGSYRLGLGIVAALAAVVGMLVVVSAAAAHARLLRSVPGDETRVARLPSAVRVFFDDAVQVASGIRVVDSAGRNRLGGSPWVRAGGRELVIPLRGGGRPGEVSALWRIVSDDGHLESGVVTFGVGIAPRRALLHASTPLPAGTAVLRAFFFAGLLLTVGAAGYVVAQGRSRVRRDRRLLGLLTGAYAAAFAGALGLAVGGPAGTRFDLAYQVGAAVAAVGCLAALAAFRYAALRIVALVAALALLPVPTLAGHALDSGQPRGLSVALDLLHVAAASLWTGGVAMLVLDLVGPREPAEGFPGIDRLRRFSAVALPSVAVLAGTGFGRAYLELDALAQLWSTGYGRVLLVKSALLLVLVVFGWRNRRRIADRVFARDAWRRPLAAELVLLGSLVAAVAVLTSLAPGVARRAAAVPARTALATGPLRLPQDDYVVQAREARELAVVLWVGPGRRHDRLRVSVLDPAGQGLSGLSLSATAAGRTERMAPCGFGCYAADVPAAGRVALHLARPDSRAERLAFRVPARAVPAAALVSRADRVYRSLRSLTIHERLASGPGDVVHTTFRVVAPDRLAYAIAGGPQAVVIGARRWDRATPDGRWSRSAQSPLREPEPFWGDGQIRNAHVLARSPSVVVVSFFAPAIPAWFTVDVDRRTLRTSRLEMIAAAHFMRHTYTGFDAPTTIEPPRVAKKP